MAGGRRVAAPALEPSWGSPRPPSGAVAMFSSIRGVSKFALCLCLTKPALRLLCRRYHPGAAAAPSPEAIDRLASPRRLGLPVRPNSAPPSSWPRARRVFSPAAELSLPSTSVLLGRGLGALLDAAVDEEDDGPRRHSAGAAARAAGPGGLRAASARGGQRPQQRPEWKASGSGGAGSVAALRRRAPPPPSPPSLKAKSPASATPSKARGSPSASAKSPKAPPSPSSSRGASQQRESPLEAAQRLGLLRPGAPGGAGTFEHFAEQAAAAAKARADRQEHARALRAAAAAVPGGAAGPNPGSSGNSPAGKRHPGKPVGDRPPWSPAAAAGAGVEQFPEAEASPSGNASAPDGADGTRAELLKEESEMSLGVGAPGSDASPSPGSRRGKSNRRGSASDSPAAAGGNGKVTSPPSGGSTKLERAAAKARQQALVDQPHFLRAPPFYHM